MRLRKIKYALDKLSKYPDIVIPSPQQYCGQWTTVFKNFNPIHLEIGIGKGQFLIQLASNNPNINYIGIEKEDSVLVRALEKVLEKPLNNIIFLHLDAFLIEEVLAINEIDKLYLNFSDPWPKNRHTKRRLTVNTILKSYQRILKNKGTLEFKTDNRKLFEYSLQEFVRNDFIINNLSLNLHEDKDKQQENIIMTEYEEKFVSLGNIIYFIEVENEKK